MTNGGPENRVVLQGRVSRLQATRHTPAGIPINRFTLRHESQQSEAGLNRRAICTIQVIAAGNELLEAVNRLRDGSLVTVSGFLARADSRQGEYRIVIHAHTLNPVNEVDEPAARIK